MKKKVLFRILFCLCAAAVLLTAAGCSLPGRRMPALTRTPFPTLYFGPVNTPTPFAAFSPVPTRTPAPIIYPSPVRTPTPVPTTGPAPTQTLGPEFFHGSLWYEPEYVSQMGLRHNGRLINSGCTAASVEMLLDFWNAYKSEYPSMTAQTLIDRNAAQHNFDPNTGLNIMETEDELNEMGYYLGVRQDSSKEELLTALERYGPLLILTKTGWTPFGDNHMAVLTGYDPEADLVRLLDPWQTGGIMEFPYKNFDGIWSLNYAVDTDYTLQRSFFFIVPYRELTVGNAPFVPLHEFAVRY